ncbi:MAG: LamG-like jellyroll fold domain-containing protein, partial [Chloroflexota bacterium]
MQKMGSFEHGYYSLYLMGNKIVFGATGPLNTDPIHTEWSGHEVNLADGAWHHLAIVISQSGTRELFIDGFLAVGNSDTNNDLILGQKNRSIGGNLTDDSANCLIADLRFWNVARTITQIQEWMRRRVPKDTDGLTAYYRLDEGTEANEIIDVQAGQNVTQRSEVTVLSINKLTESPILPARSSNALLQLTTEGNGIQIGTESFCLEAWVYFARRHIKIVNDLDTFDLTNEDYYILIDAEKWALSLIGIKAGEVETQTLDGTTVPPTTTTTTTIVRSGKFLFTLKDSNRSFLSDEVSVIGEWTHVACVYYAQNDDVVIYTNGKDISLYEVPKDPLTGDFDTTSFNVVIDQVGLAEVRIWNSAQSAALINAHMFYRIDENHPDLVAYWPLDDTLEPLVGPSATRASHAQFGQDNIAPEKKLRLINSSTHPRWVPYSDFDLFPEEIKSTQTNAPLKIGVGEPDNLMSYLGSQPASNQFKGLLDSVRIWNSARSEADIAASWNSFIDPDTEDSLVALYRFDKVASLASEINQNALSIGTVADSNGNGDDEHYDHPLEKVVDSSGNGNDGQFGRANVMANVRIWNVARTEEQIQTHKNQQITTEGNSASPNLVGHWRLDEEGGYLAKDSSSNHNHGKLGGELPARPAEGASQADIQERSTHLQQWLTQIPTWSDEGGLSFDGSSQYVDLGNDASLNLTPPFTIEAWIKMPEGIDNRDGYIIAKNNSDDTHRSFCIIVPENGSSYTFWYTYEQDGSFHKERLDKRGLALNDGQWHHIAVVIEVGIDEDGNEFHKAKLCADGDISEPVTLAGNMTLEDDDTIWIGQRKDEIIDGVQEGDFPFSGLIRDVRLWKTDLDNDEIEKTASGIHDRNGLLVNWPLDADGSVPDFTDTETIDLSKNFTIETQIKPNTFKLSGSAHRLIFKRDVWVLELYELNDGSNNPPKYIRFRYDFALNAPSGAWESIDSHSFTIPKPISDDENDDSWKYVAVVGNRSTHQLTLYLGESSFTLPTAEKFPYRFKTNRQQIRIGGEGKPKWAASDLILLDGLQFDGVDDYIDLGADPSLDLGGEGNREFTIEAWIKYQDEGYLISKNDEGNNRRFGIYVQHNNITFWYPGVSGALKNIVLDSEISLNDDNWHHLAVVVTSVNNKQKAQLFIDGVAQEVQAFYDDHPLMYVYSDDTVWVGTRKPNGHNYNFKGFIDDLRIWKVARTADQIRANRQRLLEPTSVNLVGLYRFKEGSGLTAHDSSRYANHGLLGGGIIPVPPSAPTRPQAPRSGGLSFSGTNDFIELGASDILNLGGENNREFTIEAWIKYSGSGYFLSKYSADDSHRSYGIYINSSYIN